MQVQLRNSSVKEAVHASRGASNDSFASARICSREYFETTGSTFIKELQKPSHHDLMRPPRRYRTHQRSGSDSKMQASAVCSVDNRIPAPACVTEMPAQRSLSCPVEHARSTSLPIEAALGSLMRFAAARLNALLEPLGETRTLRAILQAQSAGSLPHVHPYTSTRSSIRHN